MINNIFFNVIGKTLFKHRSPNQTEISQPSDKRITPETRIEFPALSVNPDTDDRFYLSCRVGIRVGVAVVV